MKRVHISWTLHDIHRDRFKGWQSLTLSSLSLNSKLTQFKLKKYNKKTYVFDSFEASLLNTSSSVEMMTWSHIISSTSAVKKPSIISETEARILHPVFSILVFFFWFNFKTTLTYVREMKAWEFRPGVNCDFAALCLKLKYARPTQTDIPNRNRKIRLGHAQLCQL